MQFSTTPQQRRLLKTALAGLSAHAVDKEYLPFVHLPLLVHAGICGDTRPAIPLAAATTLLFLGIDIFDDLADGDLPPHWQGYRSSEVNLAAAILLCSLPQLAIAQLEVTPSRRAAMLGTVARGLLRMAAGQQIDLQSAGGVTIHVHEVEDSVAGKSGDELAMFATLAAHLAGASTSLANRYAAFGRALGTAYQLASDCHDLFVAPISRDLTNGSRTLPIVIHLDRLANEERREFLALLHRARRSVTAQKTVRRRLREAGVLRQSAFVVEIHCQRAQRLLRHAHPLEPAASGLRTMVEKASFFSQTRLNSREPHTV